MYCAYTTTSLGTMARYFPKDIAQLIGEYAMQWMVQPWILERAPPLTKYRYSFDGILHWHGELKDEQNDFIGKGITDAGGFLIETPWNAEDDNAISDVESDDEHDPLADPYDRNSDHYLWENPRAEDFVRGLEVDWIAIAANPADWAVDLMEQLKISTSFYPWPNLSRNTNPRIRALWKQMPAGLKNPLDWGWLSANPNAMDLIWEKWRDPMYAGGVIDQCFILWNPAAEKLLTEEYKIGFNNCNICYNPDPWPALRKAQEAYSMHDALDFGFGRNPQPWAIEQMRNYTGVWTPRMQGYLYTNPSLEALAMIRDDPEKFPLAPVIWSNANIFELVVPPGLVNIIISIPW